VRGGYALSVSSSPDAKAILLTMGNTTDSQSRAAARRSWSIRAYRLGEEPSEDLSSSTTAAELTPEDLAAPDMVFQIGQSPRRIDILTSISGVAFEDAWPQRVVVEIAALAVPCLGRQELIRNKEATAREKDRVDLEILRSSDVGEG